MTQTKRTHLLLIAVLILSVTSCVPARKFEEVVERREQCEEQNKNLKEENENLFTQNNELTHEKERLEEQLEKLQNDTTETGIVMRRLQRNHEQLNKTYELIMEQNEKLLEGKELETNKILARLQETQEDLQRREDELRKATALMQEKEKNLNALNERLQQSAREIQLKEERVNELEEVLARQDSVVTALRNTVSNALLGFQNEGLTVEIRNGKVYVSLEENLLFATGSTSVDPKGVEALKQLAGVLENNSEINILIEGHTDDVPFRPGSAIKDNWELSVLRATAIVRILTTNSKIDPKRITAAGRGEFMPLDTAKTPEARQKNRRTEIILTPQLDDLFQIIEGN